MALTYLLHNWAQINRPDLQIHALTVDHRLRDEAAEEAAFVAKTMKLWGIEHKILVWDYVEAPQARLQESARDARYDLMEQYCLQKNIDYLFIAHHGNDQAETVLFRLAKGSGIDGLSGMQPIHNRGHVQLCRPLLSFTKKDLLDLCAIESIPYIEDPSNQNNKFARIRLRQSFEIMEAEGLSIKRLLKMAHRMARATEALEIIAKKCSNDTILEKDTVQTVLNYSLLSSYPDEIAIRVINNLIIFMNPKRGYGVRTERIENLVLDILGNDTFKPRTLGGIKFIKKADHLILEKE